MVPGGIFGTFFVVPFRARVGSILDAFGSLRESSRETHWDNLGCLEGHFWEALWTFEDAQDQTSRVNIAPRGQDQNGITNLKVTLWDWGRN